MGIEAVSELALHMRENLRRHAARLEKSHIHVNSRVIITKLWSELGPREEKGGHGSKAREHLGAGR